MTRTAGQPTVHPPGPAAAVVRLAGLGTALPAGSVDQGDAADLADRRCCTTAGESRWLHRVYRGTGVAQRGSVLLDGGGRDGEHDAFYGPRHSEADAGPGVKQRMDAYVEHALPLAATAARRALAQAGVAPARVGQIVTVSCTGFAAPGVDIRLIDALGLSPGVGRSAIGFMGCHGAINGLRVGRALACERPGVPVLIVAVELCSLHFQYGFNRQRIVANALFADGAAACVVQADGGSSTGGGSEGGAGAADAVGASRSSPGWQLADTASQLVPDSREAMTWTIGNHGFRMTLSPRVPALVEQHLRPWLSHWLAGHGLGVGDIEQWAVHPGGPKVLDAVEAALDLQVGALAVSRRVLAECGNMSSPTVLFIVERLRQRAAAGPCVTLAFGPGLVAEAALLLPDAGG